MFKSIKLLLILFSAIILLVQCQKSPPTKDILNQNAIIPQEGKTPLPGLESGSYSFTSNIPNNFLKKLTDKKMVDWDVLDPLL